MALDITPVSGADPTAIQAWCDVTTAVRDHDIPEWRDNPPRMIQLWFDVPVPGVDIEGYLIFNAGRPVGRLMYQIPTLENLANLSIEIWVVPEHRHRGLGRQLHDFTVKRAQELGRQRLIGSTVWELPGVPAPNLDGARFARALGYEGALADVVRRLDLSTVDDAVLAATRDEATAKATGYRTVGWVGVPPEEYLADLAYLDSRLMTDAPMGELKVEPRRADVGRLRDTFVAHAARERVSYHTAAVHERTGRLVAWTTISRDKSLRWNAFQQITIVEPEHRGHRLGALVKVENLRAFRAAAPEVTSLDTFNAATNTHMISINEAMGFRPLYAFQDWQRDI